MKLQFNVPYTNAEAVEQETRKINIRRFGTLAPMTRVRKPHFSSF